MHEISFKIERGVRQGDPLSPYLFVTAVEILAIAIGNQHDIKGIIINDLESKLLQFADDTTVVLSDLDSARALFVLLDCFEKVSGRLKLNVAKTEAMWIGSLQNKEAFSLPVRVANELYLRSFQYKVLNSFLFTNERLCKIGYVSNPNCRPSVIS